jgi:hypothetical protein
MADSLRPRQRLNMFSLKAGLPALAPASAGRRTNDVNAEHVPENPIDDRIRDRYRTALWQASHSLGATLLFCGSDESAGSSEGRHAKQKVSLEHPIRKKRSLSAGPSDLGQSCQRRFNSAVNSPV